MSFTVNSQNSVVNNYQLSEAALADDKPAITAERAKASDASGAVVSPQMPVDQFNITVGAASSISTPAQSFAQIRNAVLKDGIIDAHAIEERLMAAVPGTSSAFKEAVKNFAVVYSQMGQADGAIRVDPLKEEIAQLTLKAMDSSGQFPE